MPANQTDSAPGLVEALEQIASCESRVPGDVIDIAQKALLAYRLSGAKEAKPAASDDLDWRALATRLADSYVAYANAKLGSDEHFRYAYAVEDTIACIKGRAVSDSTAPPTLTPAIVAAAIKGMLPSMKDDERKALMYECFGAYCRDCGSSDGAACNCMRDE